MMKKIYLAGLLAASLSVVATQASASDSYAAVGLSVGTNGIGLQGTIELNDAMNLRAGVNAFSYSDKINETSVRYSGDIDFWNIGLFADYYPMRGIFRLTAGAIYNANEINAKARVRGGSITVGGQTFSAENETIRLKTDWRKLAPYFGVGWGNPVGKTVGPSFSVDLGVMLAGSPRTSLKASDGLVAIPEFGSALRSEQSRLNRRLDRSLIPVASVGFNYSF